MSRQSKNRRKAKIAREMSNNRHARRAALTPEQKRLRAQQARILREAQIAEQVRRAQEREEKRKAHAEAERRYLEAKLRRQEKKQRKTHLRNSSQTLSLPAMTVISRKSVHIKTYPAGAQVRFLGNGKEAVVVLKDQPPRLLDLETGMDREIEPEHPKDASALVATLNLNGE